MTQRQLAEKCDVSGCLKISQSYERLPLLLLNQLHGQLLQRMSRPIIIIITIHVRAGDLPSIFQQ